MCGPLGGSEDNKGPERGEFFLSCKVTGKRFGKLISPIRGHTETSARRGSRGGEMLLIHLGSPREANRNKEEPGKKFQKRGFRRKETKNLIKEKSN